MLKLFKFLKHESETKKIHIKREDLRTKLNLSLNYTFNNQEFVTDVLDLSFNGMGLMIDTVLQVGDKLTIAIDYIKNESDYVVDAVIMNKIHLPQYNKIRVGVKFHFRSAEHKHQIQSKIRELTALYI